jgi:hypothetical protein
MTEPARTLRALRGLSEALREAVAESTLAYDFTANSYSYSAMNACMGAERALDVLREGATVHGNGRLFLPRLCWESAL